MQQARFSIARRACFSSAFALLIQALMAQCNMSASVSCSPSCAPVLNAYVNIFGGTPPFHGTVSWYRGLSPGTPLTIGNTSNSFLTLDAPGNYDEFFNKVSVTLIDAMNCTATAETSFPSQTTLHVNTTTTVDQGTGNYTLRAQFVDDYGFGASWNLCNPGAVSYSLDGGPLTSVQSGWVYEDPNYRLLTPLAPGTHRIRWVAGQVVQCVGESWTRLWCFPTQYASNIWLAPLVPAAEQNGVNFSLRAGLQGPMGMDGVMSDALRSIGQVPLTEPYGAQGYSYVGAVPGYSTTAEVLSSTGYPAPVDWVVVEVRSANAPFAVLASQPALLTSSGDVRRPDGALHLHFGSLVPGSYRVAIRHRNHLAAMTAPVSMSSTLTFVDLFSTSFANNMYGSSALTTAWGRSCLWSGDANGDGVIKYTGPSNDRDPVLVAVGGNTPNAVLTNVYDRRDTNMDGVVKYTGTGNDRDVILTNVGSTTPNAVRVQQLP